MHTFTFTQSKKQRGGTIHLFTYCQGEFTLVFTFFSPFFSLGFFVCTPTAISMMVKKKRERASEYTHIHTQEHADSTLREQILYEEESSLSIFFSVHIHIDANLSDEDDVDIHIVRSFRPSYDLINNSLFVHIRIRRYTLKEEGDFLFFIASMISIAHMFKVHTCIHAIRLLFNIFTIGHMSR
jgi:hypothetical protein